MDKRAQMITLAIVNRSTVRAHSEGLTFLSGDDLQEMYDAIGRTWLKEQFELEKAPEFWRKFLSRKIN